MVCQTVPLPTKLQPLKIQGRKRAEGRDLWIDEDLSSAPSGQRQPIGCLALVATPEIKPCLYSLYIFYIRDFAILHTCMEILRRHKRRGLVTNQPVFQTPLGFVSTRTSRRFLRISSCCCCSAVQIPRSLVAAKLGQK